MEEQTQQEKTFITYADFMKVNLRIGRILEAGPHPNADKLMVLKVDLGEKVIQLVAGIRTAYTPEELPGREIVVVENLEPKPLRGVESQGMLLAASVDGKPVLLTPEKDVVPGTQVK